MAIYHFSAKVIGRSGGRSAIASAAYRAAERLHDDKLDRDHDYTLKAGVVHSEILLPDGAPVRWQDRGTLWNEVEAGEKRRDAQLARDIEISLPRELSKAEAIGLAQDFVREQFVDRGMVADLNVHWTRGSGSVGGRDADPGLQPHAHVMLTMREVVPGREGHPEEAAFGRKVVAWNDRGLLRGWRQRWAEFANERLAEMGHDVRIDHRSYADQGIELEPQNKIGPLGTHGDPERALERAAEHVEIARRNGERIIAEPGVVLDAVTRQHATFTRRDLARFVSRHTADRDQFELAMAKAETAPELVRLGTDGRGQERFTTREMLEAELRMERAAAALASCDVHQVRQAVDQRALMVAERDGLVLGDEQRVAFRHVTSGPDLALVVGYAGTGKSAMLGVARAAWEAEGFSVRGAALSGIAAEGLEAGSGIASRTLASLEFGWREGRDQLTSRDVLVVDEAGLVGSRQMERVLSAAQAAGAKVVLVGDPEQLQSIEAGAAFRALAERHGAVEISEVRRQREDWQRDATRELATARTEAALERYAAAGMVRAAETREAAKVALVAGWDAARLAAEARLADAARPDRPAQSDIILAYTRADVRDLNGLARERLRAGGALGPDQVVQTAEGARSFAAGDRLMFRQNERSLGVKNGTLGTVGGISGTSLVVRLDGANGAGTGRTVAFDVTDYGHIDHGYAATIYKAQGVTVDRAHVLASGHMDRHAAYVALTRHRDGVVLHYGQDEFSDGRALAGKLSREGLKDTSLDYDGPAEGQGPELARRYAERRGFDPLHPASEIVVRPGHGERPEHGVGALEQAAERQAEAPAPRRSKFAGLRLDASRQPERPVPQPGPVPVPRVAADRERLEGAVADYARAWSDADRMEQAGLPVLPHQAAALAASGRALDGHRVDISRDVRAALEAAPALARGIGDDQGRRALVEAATVLRRDRLALEERGRTAVRAWNTLEREYEAAGKSYEWDAQRAVGTRMEAFAKELKRDPQLDSLLRQRGRELGIAEGSRLYLVVQAREIDRALTRSIDLEHGPRMRSGPSMGM